MKKLLDNFSVAIIDDDESLRRSLCRRLRAAGLDPVAYPSAEAFLGDAHRPPFDCLLLDVQLGGNFGNRIAAAARSFRRKDAGHRRAPSGRSKCPPEPSAFLRIPLSVSSDLIAQTANNGTKQPSQPVEPKDTVCR